MRALFRTLICLIYLASATLAQAGYVINSFQFGTAGGATITFIGCTGDATDLTTYTFTNHATGVAGARKTIVGVGAADAATDFNVSSVSVGGVSATEVVDSADVNSLVQSAIYIIDNPSGTTATIDVTWSEAVTGAAICVWAAYDVLSETATATATQFQTSSAAITLSLNVNADSIAVGMSSCRDGLQTTTWAGMTERADTSVETSTHAYSAADTQTSGAPLAVTADWSGASDSIGASASFR